MEQKQPNHSRSVFPEKLNDFHRPTSELKDVKKGMRLPGKKKAKETHFYFTNARVLARFAKERQKRSEDEVVAVLFRDSDDTASAGRSEWNDKYDSVLHGFKEEDFAKGVPMIPKPKSEAWIIAGITGSPNHGGRLLEDWSGNDKSPNSLKREIKKMLGEYPSAETQCEMVSNRQVDYEKIALPSFKAFKNRLLEVI